MPAIRAVIQSATVEDRRGCRPMAPAVAEKIISELLEATATQCSIRFDGTGCLTEELPLYRHFTEYTEERRSRQIQILYELRMIVGHIDSDQARFLAENDFSVTLVNLCRGDWRKDLLSVFSCLREAGIPTTVETCITKDTVEYIDEIFEYYCKNKVFYQSYTMGGLPRKNGIMPAQYADFLKKLFDLWYSELANWRYYSVRYFDDLLRLSNGEYPPSCTLSGCCDQHYAFDVDGLVYPCERAAGKNTCLGSIGKEPLALIDLRREKCRWHEIAAAVPPQCRACRWKSLCNNGCYCQRLFADGAVGLNSYCDSYKSFFPMPFQGFRRYSGSFIIYLFHSRLPLHKLNHNIIICCLVALIACTIGSICGMGGGVIIKPVLDSLHLFSVELINLISGCTVLCMSIWPVGKGLYRRETDIQLRTATLLAISSTVGGVTGKSLLRLAAAHLSVPNHIGAIQAGILFAATMFTFLYTANRSKFPPKHITAPMFCLLIGFLLGNMGAFLGIGGGPFNVAALSYFFSMGTKQTAQNSLYIIVFSQAAGLLSMIFSHSVPAADPLLILLMSACGILGSEIGRRCSRRLSEREAAILFEAAMILVMIICLYNLYGFVLQKR